MKYIVSAVVLVIVVCGLLFTSSTQKRQPLSYAVFQTASGWGYDIKAHEKIIIHQDVVPAVAVAKGFATKAQAAAAATLVIKKLELKQVPSLTTSDLEQITGEASMATGNSPAK